MGQGRKPKAVTFYAPDEFELARGLILPAGQYSGWQRSSAFSTMQASKMLPSRYELEFTGEHLQQLGAFGGRGTELAVYDVTKQVSEGMLVLNE